MIQYMYVYILKMSEDTTAQGIFIAPDLSKEDREAQKKLREELKNRRLKGETVYIRGNRIITSDATQTTKSKYNSASKQKN